MRRTTKGKILKISALVLDVGAPLAATMTQFPMWINRSAGATVSGTFVLFALLSAIPFFKQIKAFFKSPSVWVMWIIMFVVLVVLREIIDEMLVICFVGAIANIIGAALYKVGERCEKQQGDAQRKGIDPGENINGGE